MSVNDRGRVKWQPFLIPEHKQRLARFYAEDDAVNPPEIDEHMIEKLQEVISEAMHNKSEICITYYRAESKFVANGTIIKVDPLTSIIVLAGSGTVRSVAIPFREIGDINLC